MFAILAFIAFILALVLHLVGGGAGKYVIDFELIGFIFVAAHLAWGFPLPWARPRP
jgi:hypothetical protein